MLGAFHEVKRKTFTCKPSVLSLRLSFTQYQQRNLLPDSQEIRYNCSK